MIVEVLGPEPPCARCKKTFDIVKQAVDELKLSYEVKKIDAFSRSTISRYGLVLTPAVAIGGKISIAGRIPGLNEVKNLLSATS